MVQSTPCSVEPGLFLEAMLIQRKRGGPFFSARNLKITQNNLLGGEIRDTNSFYRISKFWDVITS